MTDDRLLSRISLDSNICFGKPCIRGHRINHERTNITRKNHI
ncbi:DUF433 domain-containing protein [Nostoc sp. DSM 114159]